MGVGARGVVHRKIGLAGAFAEDDLAQGYADVGRFIRGDPDFSRGGQGTGGDGGKRGVGVGADVHGVSSFILLSSRTGREAIRSGISKSGLVASPTRRALASAPPSPASGRGKKRARSAPSPACGGGLGGGGFGKRSSLMRLSIDRQAIAAPVHPGRHSL